MTVRIEQLVAAGLMPPSALPFRGMGGMGYLAGKANPFMGRPADSGANTASFESAYQQVQSLTSQLGTAAAEVNSLARGVDDTEVLALVDDANLLAEEAGARASQAQKIYNFDRQWVEGNVDQLHHGGWAFGRAFVLTDAGATAPENRSGQPLYPGHRNEIINAATAALKKIQAEVARAIGQVRGVRQQVALSAQNFAKRQADQQRSAAIAAAAQAREDAKVAAAEALEQRRADQQAQAEERRAAIQEAAEQARLSAEQRRLDAQIQQEAARAQLEQKAIDAQLQSQQQSLLAQQQAEQQRQAQELANQQYSAQIEQQRLATQAQIDQQRQAAMFQSELAKLQPPPPPTYGYGALNVPPYGVPQGVVPQPLVPPAWQGYQEAAQYGAASMPFVTPQSASAWSPGGELFGLGASPPPKPGTFGSAVDAVANLFSKVAPGAADIVGAARGQPRQLPMEEESGGGLGSLLVFGAVVAGGIYVGKKLLGKKKGGRRRRSR